MLQYIFFLIFYPAFLILSVYSGHVYAQRRTRMSKSWTNIGLESSLMSIFALLLSFTLVLSSNHATERDNEIYSVSDRLSVLVKKSKYYEEGIRQGLNIYFKKFFDIHDGSFKSNSRSSDEIVKMVIQNDQQLDVFLIAYLKKNPVSNSQISEITDHTSKLRSEYIRLVENNTKSTPTLIISILILYSLMMGFLIGFMSKAHQVQTHMVTVMFIAISAVMVGAIWDQDHPAIGLLSPDYKSIDEVSNLFKAYLRRG